MPITTVARTIADLRRVLAPPKVREAIRQAEMRGYPLGGEVETDRSRSELEWRFLVLCRRHGLPEPEVNVRVGPHLVDFLWRELRLLGFEVIRLSAPQIRDQSAAVASLLSHRLESPSTD